MNEAAPSSWHQLGTDTLLLVLEVDPTQGLNNQEAKERLRIYGPNQLTPNNGNRPIVLFLRQFHHPLIYLLLASALVTALLKRWLDFGVVVGVVIINAGIRFNREIRALGYTEALANALPDGVAVLRDGHRRVIPVLELVPGDTVFLQSGDKVPADLRLLRVGELKIDESTLTGEKGLKDKQCEALPEDTLRADRSNMAYASTLVSSGTGVGIVVATGDRTEIGQIAHRFRRPCDRIAASSPEAVHDTLHRVKKLPQDVGWLLLGVGIAGFVAPGIVGLPFMVAGGMVLWPGSERWLQRWMEDGSQTSGGGLKQITRFLDDLERRYPQLPK